MPGEKLGIIEQYLPGEGTYDDNGEIKSSVLGNVKINQKKKVISVVSDAKPALLKVGDIVYGQITDIKPQRANVKIECIKDNARPLALPYMGAIHISQAKKDYLEKLSDAFRIGDIIQAKVVKITGDNVDLGTGRLRCAFKSRITDRQSRPAAYGIASSVSDAESVKTGKAPPVCRQGFLRIAESAPGREPECLNKAG